MVMLLIIEKLLKSWKSFTKDAKNKVERTNRSFKTKEVDK